MTKTNLEKWQLLINYDNYCLVTNSDENASHEWFDMDQKLALSIIYKNMTQTHIFPMDRHMFLHMKPQYKELFTKALAWQVKYINDNQDLYDNPTQYLASHTLGTSSTGPINQVVLDTLMDVLSPKARYYLGQMGWLYKSLTDHYELEQFYDNEVDDDYAMKSDVTKGVIEAELYTDVSIEELNKYIAENYQPLLSKVTDYGENKYLKAIKDAEGKIVLQWTDVAAPILDNFYTKEQTDTKLATKQSKVQYSAEEPKEPVDGDIWIY